MPTKMGKMPMAVAGKSKGSAKMSTHSGPYQVRQSGPSTRNVPTNIGKDAHSYSKKTSGK